MLAKRYSFYQKKKMARSYKLSRAQILVQLHCNSLIFFSVLSFKVNFVNLCEYSACLVGTILSVLFF